MYLLNILASGGLFWGITGVWAALTGWFMYQAVKAHNSGWRQTDKYGKEIGGPEKIPYMKIPQTKFAIAVTILYVVALLVIASDYRGVEP